MITSLDLDSICADPVIASALRTLNDSLGDEDRQILKPYIVRVIGTKGSEALSLRRSWMAIDWIVREYTPAWLDLAEIGDDATALRALPEITMRTATDALPTIRSAQKRAAAARAAARAATGAAAWAATGAAAWAAAWDAAGDAAGDAARAAARDAAWYAARAAAWGAAGDAARAAARDAARAASLRKSFLALLDRMIDAPEFTPIPDGTPEPTA
jgi:hypothetical protein